MAPGVPLHELRLLVGPHLIAKAEINQPRPDVCETLGWQGLPGFRLELPSELPLVSWQEPPRVVAFSADASQQVELGLMGRRQQTAAVLKALLQSDLLGLVGHCDGLVMGSIRGWAGRRGQQEPAQIWLQAVGLDAVLVPCHGHREGLQATNLPSNCGFVVDPGSLPGGWAGQEVWLSFDRESQYRLPQLGSIVLPNQSSAAVAASAATLRAQPAQPFQAMMQAAPEDLQEHWRALESFRAYLDSMERQLAQQQAQALASLTQKPASSRWRWWARLPGAGG
ncbi:MAG: hypothetical protein ACKO8I_02540 [Cyanobacteriota bacterium]